MCATFQSPQMITSRPLVPSACNGAMTRSRNENFTCRRSGELAFAAGLEVGRLTNDESAVLDAADAAFKAYRKVKTFWPSSDGRNGALNLSKPRLQSV